MKKALLWRIAPADGGRESYLFGTMHVRDLRAFGWLDLAQTYIDRCDLFATEFDFLEADGAALAQVMQLPEGQTLDKMLKPGPWKMLDHYTQKKLGIPAEALRGQHPMSISTLLTTAVLMEEATQSLDETLWQYARTAGKTTCGVESFEDQLQTIGKIPFATHLKSLNWLLRHYGRQKKQMRKMMRWYQAGNILQLYRSSKKDAKGMRKVLLYDRNATMVQRFIELTREGSLFCAVGAGHLAGQKGMLRLLKKAGFKVSACTEPTKPF